MLLEAKNLQFSESLTYEITCPDGSKITPIKNRKNIWRWSQKKFLERLENGFVDFIKDDNTWKIYTRQFMNVDYDDNPIERGSLIRSVIDNVDGREGTKLLTKILGSNQFSNPKSIEILLDLFCVASNNNDIILDFHAGSGTTAHAVLDLNKEDGGNRKFILVEQMDYIETITCERVKKVIEKNQEGSFIYAELKTIDTFNEADTIGRLNDNMRYLPLGEIDDESYGISESEKALNKQFYGVE